MVQLAIGQAIGWLSWWRRKLEEGGVQLVTAGHLSLFACDRNACISYQSSRPLLPSSYTAQVKEFSPQQLVTLIYFLAGYLHGPGAAVLARQDPKGPEHLEGGIGGTSVGVPTLLLEEAARRIAGAIQNNRLTAHEIAQV